MRSNVIVQITQHDVGYTVQAGCVTVAFVDRSALIGELVRWLENPVAVELEYSKKVNEVRDIENDPRAGRIYESAEAGRLEHNETIGGLTRSRFVSAQDSAYHPPPSPSRPSNR